MNNFPMFFRVKIQKKHGKNGCESNTDSYGRGAPGIVINKKYKNKII